MFARTIGAPYFLVCVIKDMRSMPVTAMEQAFLDELAGKATAAGGRSPGFRPADASNLALLYDADLNTVREIEAHLQRYLAFANHQRRPGLVADLLHDWLQVRDGWVLETIAFSICAAALKGSLN
jgi:hypothetical protein